jgi:hypothetical protein
VSKLKNGSSLLSLLVSFSLELNAVTLVAGSEGFFTFAVDVAGFFTETNATFLDPDLNFNVFELGEVFEAVGKPSSCGSFLLGVAAMSEPSPTSV